MRGRLAIAILLTLAIAGSAVAQSARKAKPTRQAQTCDGGTAELVACLNRLTERADRRLNSAYRKALADAQPEQRDKLVAAQRLWIQYRDANCDYYAYGEGTITRVEAADCLRRMTESRARELEVGPVN